MSDHPVLYSIYVGIWHVKKTTAAFQELSFVSPKHCSAGNFRTILATSAAACFASLSGWLMKTNRRTEATNFL